MGRLPPVSLFRNNLLLPEWNRDLGGFREPGTAPIRHAVKAHQKGWIEAIDNRRLSRVAKLAGAPISKTAGVDVHVRVGDHVEPGMSILTIHAEAPGEMAYAMDYLTSHPVFLYTSKSLDE